MFRILSYSILAAFYLSLLTKIAVQKVQKLRVIRPEKKDPAPLRRLGIALLDAIESDDPTALIGLPLIRTARLLRAAGCVLP